MQNTIDKNMRRSGFNIISIILVSLFSIKIALAENFLSAIFEPFAGFDIAQVYLNPSFTPFIDAIIVFSLFLGISKISLGKLDHFKGPGGTLTITMFSIALTVGFMVFEFKTGWNISNLGPLAAMIFVLVLCSLVFYLIKGFGGENSGAGAAAFFFLYIVMSMVIPQLFDWLSQNPWGKTLFGFLNILFLISIFSLFSKVSRLFKSVMGKPTSSDTLNNPKSGQTLDSLTPQNAAKKDEIISELKKDIATEKLERKLNNIEHHLEKGAMHHENSISKEIRKLEDAYRTLYTYLENLLKTENQIQGFRREFGTDADKKMADLKASFKDLKDKCKQYFNKTIKHVQNPIKDFEKIKDEDEKILNLSKDDYQNDKNFAARLDKLLSNIKNANNGNLPSDIKTKTDTMIGKINKVNEIIAKIYQKISELKTLNQQYEQNHKVQLNFLRSTRNDLFKNDNEWIDTNKLNEIMQTINNKYRQGYQELNELYDKVSKQNSLILNLLNDKKHLEKELEDDLNSLLRTSI